MKFSLLINKRVYCYTWFRLISHTCVFGCMLCRSVHSKPVSSLISIRNKKFISLLNSLDDIFVFGFDRRKSEGEKRNNTNGFFSFLHFSLYFLFFLVCITTVKLKSKIENFFLYALGCFYLQMENDSLSTKSYKS